MHVGGHVWTRDMVTSATATVVVVQHYYNVCPDLQQVAGCLIMEQLAFKDRLPPDTVYAIVEKQINPSFLTFAYTGSDSNYRRYRRPRAAARLPHSNIG